MKTGYRPLDFYTLALGILSTRQETIATIQLLKEHRESTMAPRKRFVFECMFLMLALGRAIGNDQDDYDYDCEDVLEQVSRFPPSNAVVTQCCSSNGVRYKCINGYQLVSGYQERVCQNGSLTGTEPVCEFPKVTSCGNPGPIIYGYFIGSSFNISSQVTYKCYSGFTMHGHPHRTCMENGLWSEPPTCTFDDDTTLDIDTATDVISNSILNSLYETKCTEPGPSCQPTSFSRRRRALDVEHSGGLDLVFMFDGSSSVKKEEFKMGLRFAQELVRILDATIRRGGIKVAALTYAASMKINFQFISATERTLKKIWSIKKPGGCGSNLGRSMFLLRKRIAPGVRIESKRALFIISNGRLIMGTSHKRAARLLRTENHFDIFVIGVGKNPNKEDLSSLVSEPVKDHFILLKVFSDVFSSVRKALSSGKDTTKCGISNTKPKSRSIRGNKAASGAWPWQIGIYWDRGRSPICGGALIGDQWVLTAAHCFYSSARKAITWPPWRYTVVAGDHQASRRENSKQMAPVGKIYVNKNYRYHTNQNDIALVKLQYKLKMGKHVRPVCLPRNNFRNKKTSDSGKHGFVAEWDRPENEDSNPRSKSTRRKNRSRVLVHTALVISPSSQCLNITSKPFNSSLMFCAMDKKSFKQNCRGDGGSPFVSEKYDQSSRDYRWSVDGLVSWDEKCGTEKHHRFFTRVHPYAQWIKRLMRAPRRQ